MQADRISPIRRAFLQVSMLYSLLALSGCPAPHPPAPPTAASPPPPALPGPPPPPPAPAYRLHGLNFGPYVGGADPNHGAVASEATLSSLMATVAPYTDWIRTFGSTQGLERAGATARRLGLKTALGAWLGRDRAANERELQSLVRAAQSGEADIAIVGSEVLLRGDLSEAELLGHIDRFKRAAPGVPVSYADTYAVLLSHPALLAAVDVVLVNVHPFWEGIALAYAVAAIHGWHKQVVAAAGTKPVIVSETGWPSSGNSVGHAVPSAANASLFFLDFVSWARATGTPYFYFSALDEAFKSNYEGPVGAHWGVWTEDSQLKPGMQRVFNGETLPDHWSQTPVPGGPGAPTIELTVVPRRGSSTDLQGQVLHVNPLDFKVAVFIYVGGWWTKPTFAQPLSTIQLDGRWICDVTTGGNDALAIAIAAYVLPNGYAPPLLAGAGALPAELDAHAIAKVLIDR